MPVYTKKIIRLGPDSALNQKYCIAIINAWSWLVHLSHMTGWQVIILTCVRTAMHEFHGRMKMASATKRNCDSVRKWNLVYVITKFCRCHLYLILDLLEVTFDLGSSPVVVILVEFASIPFLVGKYIDQLLP